MSQRGTDFLGLLFYNTGPDLRVARMPLRVVDDQPLLNWIVPPLAAIFTVSLAPNSPSRMRFASGFSMLAWIARLSGRAPYTGSKPALAISASALSATSSLISIPARRLDRIPSWIFAMLLMFF